MKLAEASQCKEPDDYIKLLEPYEKNNPRALVPRRLQLNYAFGDKFEELVDKYLRRGKLQMILSSFSN